MQVFACVYVFFLLYITRISLTNTQNLAKAFNMILKSVLFDLLFNFQLFVSSNPLN